MCVEGCITVHTFIVERHLVHLVLLLCLVCHWLMMMMMKKKSPCIVANFGCMVLKLHASSCIYVILSYYMCSVPWCVATCGITIVLVS